MEVGPFYFLPLRLCISHPLPTPLDPAVPAANVLKCVKELRSAGVVDEGQRCVCHNMHLCVTEALKEGPASLLVDAARTIAITFKNIAVMKESLASRQRDRMSGVL